MTVRSPIPARTDLVDDRKFCTWQWLKWFEWVSAQLGAGGGGVSLPIAESDVTNLTTDLAAKVAGNAPITPATKTKITYDAKGLVTAGANATTADIADSTNKRYVTDAELTVLGNTSGTNTGDQSTPSGSGWRHVTAGVEDGAASTISQPHGIVIDGGGQVPATGSKGYFPMPYAGTITAWKLIADQSGDAQITVKKCSDAGFPTTASIVAAAPPKLTGAQKNSSSSLGTWTTAIASGDILEYVLDSVTTCTRLTLELTIQRS